MNRWANAKMMMVGMMDNTAPADMAPQSTSNFMMNEFIATGSVFKASLSMNMTARNSSFQFCTKAKMNVDAIPAA